MSIRAKGATLPQVPRPLPSMVPSKTGSSGGEEVTSCECELESLERWDES